MRAWARSGAKTIVAGSAIVSVLTHASLITAWVLGTLPADGLPEKSIANRIFYVPPPDRVPTDPGRRETIRYVALGGPGGVGAGDGPQTTIETRGISGSGSPAPSSPPRDTSTAPAAPPTPKKDSVYTVIDVDTAVARMASSAAPAYPITLLQAKVQGYVDAEYVVDTTGFADLASFRVLQSTNPEFVASVKDALPYMRFFAAKMGSIKVRQIVQQRFNFRINDTTAAKRPPDAGTIAVTNGRAAGR